MYVANVFFLGNCDICSQKILHGAQNITKYRIGTDTIKGDFHWNEWFSLKSCDSSETDIGQKWYSSPKAISDTITERIMIRNDK